jgi:acyl CoA:acetate/3-ketoacid CoA transferase
MEGATYRMRNGKLSIRKTGNPKFVERVDKITFNGREALAHGKKVYYVTNVSVVPGIDVENDIIRHTKAKIVVPRDVPLRKALW